MNTPIKPKTPTIIVVLGATGDLMKKKIVPALFHLSKDGELPAMFRLVGFSRQELSDSEFQTYVGELLATQYGTEGKSAHIPDFVRKVAYSQGEFGTAEDYARLNDVLARVDKEWGVCSNKLFYLAVPPASYEIILKHLASSGLTKPCGGDEGWTRVLVEKPFGRDAKSAEELDILLGSLFKEEQIYRIDHYLAKEMLQNILTFRFSNNLLEKSWDNRSIESIHIRLWETLGAEDRGAFYDGVGALRDVGQNHLLQILALLTMAQPATFGALDIRGKRAEALALLEVPEPGQIQRETFRAQYEGYRSIKGVAPDSSTETYFRVTAHLDSHDWRGVPIILEGGKRMKEVRKEIVLTFRHPTPCLCPPSSPAHLKNRLTIHIEPKEGITISFWSKKPGFTMDIEERLFDFNFRPTADKAQYTEEYEKALLDCINGDQTLFVGSDEIGSMWRFTDAITRAWKTDAVPLGVYTPGTNEAVEQAEERLSKRSAPAQSVGVIGLGKMGGNMARRLLAAGWHVAGYNAHTEATDALAKDGLDKAVSLSELVQKLPTPRFVWLMVPYRAVDDVLKELVPLLLRGDMVVDGGNSPYKESIRRARELEAKGIEFLDIGVSGGPGGALTGACMMVGGKKEVYRRLEDIGFFRDTCVPNGWRYMGEPGAGHFVKMVHNGIEYGMMQSIAEGFEIMKTSAYSPNLHSVAELYNHGSVVESRLVGWLSEAYVKFTDELNADECCSGEVSHTGEGEWTIDTARELGVPTAIIEGALEFRKKSLGNPSYAGKVVSAMRHQFGGHDARNKKNETV